MNELFLIGKVIDDVELKKENGITDATFTLAVDRNAPVPITDIFQIEAHQGLAEIIASSCGKGSKIAVEAVLRGDFHENNGQRFFNVKIEAKKIEPLILRKPRASAPATDRRITE